MIRSTNNDYVKGGGNHPMPVESLIISESNNVDLKKIFPPVTPMHGGLIQKIFQNISYPTLVFFLIVFFVSGCATMSIKNPEEALRKSVEEYAKAKSEGKWDIVYSFFCPDYRKTISKEEFLGRKRKTKIKAYNIEKVEIQPSGNEAIAFVNYDISFMGFDFKGAPEKQTWILTKRKWYIQFDPYNTPFGSTKKKAPADKVEPGKK